MRTWKRFISWIRFYWASSRLLFKHQIELKAWNECVCSREERERRKRKWQEIWTCDIAMKISLCCYSISRNTRRGRKKNKIEVVKKHSSGIFLAFVCVCSYNFHKYDYSKVIGHPLPLVLFNFHLHFSSWHGSNNNKAIIAHFQSIAVAIHSALGARTFVYWFCVCLVWFFRLDLFAQMRMRTEPEKWDYNRSLWAFLLILKFQMLSRRR